MRRFLQIASVALAMTFTLSLWVVSAQAPDLAERVKANEVRGQTMEQALVVVQRDITETKRSVSVLGESLATLQGIGIGFGSVITILLGIQTLLRKEK